ncbi:trypsin-like peptidase domain-containing protein [Erythrobacter sp. EC-HK427]|uniref:trypsin-like peptidase domain-containing protein n=1 Tax=Erythrobacter sp. EC-HK427 TaxID=2038396 RepID=UPI0012530B66|nr:trypsin-like peptidase domain-containing protein [Erythrobacter sp. EC-HK427]VVT19292.1 conserved exported hypothetical protein [Erythrobacter sp. EC-HK427]
MRLLHLVCAAILCALALARPIPAAADPEDIEAATRGVVRVVIIGQDGTELYPISHGTGFSVGGERIVTNAHVIAQAMDDDRLAIGIVPADRDVAVYARVIAYSERNDLAIIEATEPLGLPALTIAGNPATTGAVTAIGYPLNVDRAQGLSFSDMFRAQPPVTAAGSLAGRRPSRDFDTLLHTAPIAAGNSGGPLVDDCGRVLGVNSFGAQSDGSDAEFFFAVSTRELLPFLRANNVAPRLNSGPCRSLAELDAEEAAREAEARAAAQNVAEAEAAAQAQATEEARRLATFEVLEERDTKLALAFLLLLIGAGTGGVAAYGHIGQNPRLRAAAGGVALLCVAGAAIAWITRPHFNSIDTRTEERLREAIPEREDSGTIDLAAGAAGEYQCVLDADRSRVTGDPEEQMALTWTETGCVNGRTQYGLDAGEWTRVFVPNSEAAVSINSFDPAAGEFVMERYLLAREPMDAARAARGDYSAPSCEAGEDGANRLGAQQAGVTSALPDRPNERLVYRCTKGETE